MKKINIQIVLTCDDEYDDLADAFEDASLDVQASVEKGLMSGPVVDGDGKVIGSFSCATNNNP